MAVEPDILGPHLFEVDPHILRWYREPSPDGGGDRADERIDLNAVAPLLGPSDHDGRMGVLLQLQRCKVNCASSCNDCRLGCKLASKRKQTVQVADGKREACVLACLPTYSECAKTCDGALGAPCK